MSLLAAYAQIGPLFETQDPATTLLVLLVFFLLLVLIVILAHSIRVINEYERAVVFRLGRAIGVIGPGLVFIIPVIDRLTVVDLRIRTVDVPGQKIITRDNVEISVDAVVYYRVQDPMKAVLTVYDYNTAVTRLSQTILRDVIGRYELDDILAKREELSKELQKILDEHTDPWGIKVTAVTLREIVLPEGMVRAMARQAEAERWRRAKIIEAEGERQSANILAEAAMTYAQHPVALRLRELHTLAEIAKERNIIVFFPTSIGQEAGVLAAAASLPQALQKQRQEG